MFLCISPFPSSFPSLPPLFSRQTRRTLRLRLRKRPLLRRRRKRPRRKAMRRKKKTNGVVTPDGDGRGCTQSHNPYLATAVYSAVLFYRKSAMFYFLKSQILCSVELDLPRFITTCAACSACAALAALVVSLQAQTPSPHHTSSRCRAPRRQFASRVWGIVARYNLVILAHRAGYTVATG